MTEMLWVICGQWNCPNKTGCECFILETFSMNISCTEMSKREQRSGVQTHTGVQRWMSQWKGHEVISPEEGTCLSRGPKPNAVTYIQEQAFGTKGWSRRWAMCECVWLNQAGRDAHSECGTDYSFNLGFTTDWTKLVILCSGPVAVGN